MPIGVILTKLDSLGILTGLCSLYPDTFTVLPGINFLNKDSLSKISFPNNVDIAGMPLPLLVLIENNL